MHKTRIGVIRGGQTPAYDLSLKTGAAALRALSEDRFETRDIFIDKNGQWHVRGRPVPPDRALSQIDAALIAIHGNYGEDGTLARLLEAYSVPYVGTDAFGQTLTLSKKIAKDQLAKAGVMTPVATMLTQEEYTPSAVINLFRSFPQPSIIKPLSGGSSIGVTVARDYASFAEGIRSGLSHAPVILIEEYIVGKEATVGTIDGFRDEIIYVLPPVEVDRNPGLGHYDYARKLAEDVRHEAFGTFSSDEKQELGRLAKEAHRILGLRDVGRHDFVVSRRGILFIESNTVPELHRGSPMRNSLEAVGSSVGQYLEHVINRALSR